MNAGDSLRALKFKLIHKEKEFQIGIPVVPFGNMAVSNAIWPFRT